MVRASEGSIGSPFMRRLWQCSLAERVPTWEGNRFDDYIYGVYPAPKSRRSEEVANGLGLTVRDVLLPY